MLSDYNLLAPDDKRIKEVTDLGLAYNLLTNYTSFVAVDSEVRNKTGQSTTVKQALPLPDGVSDYAVGNAYAPASAPMPAKMLQRSMTPMAEGYAGAVMAQDKLEMKKDKGATVSFKVADVTASGGLTKEAVRRAVEQQLQSLTGCFATTHPKAKITLKLTINAGGGIKGITATSKEIKDKAVLECLQMMVKAWSFGTSSTGRETEATVTIQIG